MVSWAHFHVRVLPVVLAGSAKKRRGDHVIGQLPPNYFLLPAKVDVAVTANFDTKHLYSPGSTEMAAVAKRLGHKDVSILRNAVASAHSAGVRKFMEVYNIDRLSQATAALRALRSFLPRIDDPTFIPAIRLAERIVTAENPSFGGFIRDLARGLDHVDLLTSIVAEEQHRAKPVKRKVSRKTIHGWTCRKFGHLLVRNNRRVSVDNPHKVGAIKVAPDFVLEICRRGIGSSRPRAYGLSGQVGNWSI